MDLLLDTQVLVWTGTGSRRLSYAATGAIADAANACFVSAVVAWEFVDLNSRGRFGANLELGDLLAQLNATVLDFPADGWRLAERLPWLHRDPVDRMIVGHAIHSDLTVVTSDKAIRDYPVRSIW